MSKTVRDPKPQGANAALKESMKRLEGRIAALETAITQHASRIDAVEVVKAGPQDPKVMEPELPFDEQKPETE